MSMFCVYGMFVAVLAASSYVCMYVCVYVLLSWCSSGCYDIMMMSCDVVRTAFGWSLHIISLYLHMPASNQNNTVARLEPSIFLAPHMVWCVGSQSLPSQ